MDSNTDGTIETIYLLNSRQSGAPSDLVPHMTYVNILRNINLSINKWHTEEKQEEKQNSRVLIVLNWL